MATTITATWAVSRVSPTRVSSRGCFRRLSPISTPITSRTPSDLTPRARGRRRYRPRAGSRAWVVLWIVRLAVLAFIVYVAVQVFHGATSTPSP